MLKPMPGKEIKARVSSRLRASQSAISHFLARPAAAYTLAVFCAHLFPHSVTENEAFMLLRLIRADKMQDWSYAGERTLKERQSTVHGQTFWSWTAKGYANCLFSSGASLRTNKLCFGFSYGKKYRFGSGSTACLKFFFFL